MRIRRSLWSEAWATAALVLAACGGSAVGSGGVGSTGVGGETAGGGGACAQEAFPCCPPGEQGSCCAQCGDASTSVGTGIGDGGGFSGGGGPCGGLAGTPCAADEYCDFPDDQCGGDDGAGVCTARPIGCSDVYEPACGCDGKVYDNACDASAHGADVDDLGGCAAPSGTFGCGAQFCTLGMQYCERDTSDVGGVPSKYVCQPLPAACGGAPSCACLSAVPCGGLCTPTSDGGLEVTCPAG